MLVAPGARAEAAGWRYAAIADAAKLREDKNWKNVETLAIFNSPYTTRIPLGTEKVKP